VATVHETSVSFTDCAGQHVGEVVAFRMTPRSSGGAADGSQWCTEVADGYRSSTTRPAHRAAGQLWHAVDNHLFLAILSASIDHSRAACAVLSPGLEPYSGSNVASLPGLLPAPAPFDSRRTGETYQTQISCSSPHRVQEFGVAVRSGMSSREAVAACRELVLAMTRLPDVNAGGLFKIQVVGGSLPTGGGDFGGAGADAGDSGRCRSIAVGPRQLNGTLIGIGSVELPWG
jgi:hypothetical protein